MLVINTFLIFYVYSSSVMSCFGGRSGSKGGYGGMGRAESYIIIMLIYGYKFGDNKMRGYHARCK